MLLAVLLSFLVVSCPVWAAVETELSEYLEYCDPVSIVPSTQEKHGLYLKANCYGVPNFPREQQCSYLDLNHCFGPDESTNLPRERFGHGLKTCKLATCSVDTSNLGRPLSVTCSDCGGKKKSLLLSNYVEAKFGFLSCRGIAGFQCPEPGQKSPWLVDVGLA